MKPSLPHPFATGILNITNQIGFIILGTLLLYLCAHYISYAYLGWFFQDDFGLMIGYRGALHLEQASTFVNLGRTVSRNLYWHFGELLFSGDASRYFLFNFGTLILASFFIFKIFVHDVGKTYSLILVAVFLGLPPVWVAYIWIANSQHIIAYLLVFVFAHYFLSHLNDNRYDWRYWILFALYAIGLASNIIFGLVIALPVLGLFFKRTKAAQRGNITLILFCSILFAYFIVQSSAHSVGPYESQLSLDVVHRNARFYFGGAVIFWVWIFIACVGFVYSMKRRFLLSAWCFISAALFYIPFSTLVEQRYLQYATLTYFFSIAGFLTLVINVYGRNIAEYGKAAAVAILALLIIWQTLPLMERYQMWPTGHRQKAIVEDMQRINSSMSDYVDRYCFGESNSSGGENVYPNSGEWLALSHGWAFTLFVDDSKQYFLASESNDCDAIILINGEQAIHWNERSEVDL